MVSSYYIKISLFKNNLMSLITEYFPHLLVNTTHLKGIAYILSISCTLASKLCCLRPVK